MAQTMKAFVMKQIGQVGLWKNRFRAQVQRRDHQDDSGTHLHLRHTHRGWRHRREDKPHVRPRGRRCDLQAWERGSRFKEGDRVVVNAITPCFQCENCLRGYSSQCTQMLGGWKFANVKDGNMAEYFHVNNAQANLAPIPDSLTDEQVAYCTDMMSTGFMGAEHAAFQSAAPSQYLPRDPSG